jgi:hypothetical protein
MSALGCNAAFCVYRSRVRNISAEKGDKRKNEQSHVSIFTNTFTQLPNQLLKLKVPKGILSLLQMTLALEDEAVPQHTYGGAGGRGDIAPTHS